MRTVTSALYSLSSGKITMQNLFPYEEVDIGPKAAAFIAQLKQLDLLNSTCDGKAVYADD